mmetsp:Transcript_80975/g.203796  ORF Transcript_80975/g.203796 Transcript_80975/m.203796 type:complete len:229 (+) Transcript_80975:400-1086(+)
MRRRRSFRATWAMSLASRRMSLLRAGPTRRHTRSQLSNAITASRSTPSPACSLLPPGSCCMVVQAQRFLATRATSQGSALSPRLSVARCGTSGIRWPCRRAWSPRDDLKAMCHPNHQETRQGARTRILPTSSRGTWVACPAPQSMSMASSTSRQTTSVTRCSASRIAWASRHGRVIMIRGPRRGQKYQTRLSSSLPHSCSRSRCPATPVTSQAKKWSPSSARPSARLW